MNWAINAPVQVRPNTIAAPSAPKRGTTNKRAATTAETTKKTTLGLSRHSRSAIMSRRMHHSILTRRCPRILLPKMMRAAAVNGS